MNIMKKFDEWNDGWNGWRGILSNFVLCGIAFAIAPKYGTLLFVVFVPAAMLAISLQMNTRIQKRKETK